MDKLPFSNFNDELSGLISGNKLIIERVTELLGLSRNVVLVSPRGWQLSDLVLNIGRKLESHHNDIRICFLDLKLVSTRDDFEESVFTGILNINRPEDKYRVRKAHGPVSNLTLPVRFATGTKSRLLVFVNNFQTITRFDRNKDLQRTLRFHWKDQENCAFFIYGENQESYLDLFRDRRSPLTGFANFYHLRRMETKALTEYILNEFENNGKRIDYSLARLITRLTEEHPFYAKILARQTWLITKLFCTLEDITIALENILDQYNLHYYRITDRLTCLQLRFLKALLSEENKLCSTVTIKKYNLGTSAHIARCRINLERQEILLCDKWEMRFTDPIYRIWLKTRYFELPDPYPAFI